jgi:hypothetical protein
MQPTISSFSVGEPMAISTPIPVIKFHEDTTAAIEVVNVPWDFGDESDSFESVSSDSDYDSPMLFENSRLTAAEFEKQFSLCIRQHHISKEAAGDILKLFVRVSPSDSKYPTMYSMDKKRKAETSDNTTFVQHVSGTIVYFNIEAQLKALTSTYWEHLETRNSLQNLHDIMDGEVYKLCQSLENSHSNVYYLHALLNTDGVTLLKSKRNSFWPIFMSIIELPMRLRQAFKNLITCAIWYGTSKPEWPNVLPEIVESLKKLYLEGFSIEINRREVIVRLHVICLVADMPAKASILNITQFNGFYGCPHCLEKGLYLNRRMLYPVTNPMVPRTNEHYIQYLSPTETQTYGIKGPTLLSEIMKIPENIGIDYMHQVLLGIYKNFLLSFVQSSIIDKRRLNEIDACLLSIKCPSYWTRKFRGISELQYWKAQEFRNFMLHTAGIPLLVLSNEDHACHLIMLANIIRLLNGVSISDEDIIAAEELINLFCTCAVTLYSENAQSYNLHALRHLPSQVRMFGPLRCTSAFAFESANHHLARSVTGTRGQLECMVNSVITRQIDNHRKTFPMMKNRVTIAPKIQAIMKANYLNEEEFIAFARFKNTFRTFHSLAYTHKQSSNCYTISLNRHGRKEFCEVEVFLQNIHTNETFAVVTLFQRKQCYFRQFMSPLTDSIKHFCLTFPFEDFFVPCNLGSSYEIISCSDICTFALRFPLHDFFVLTELCVDYEHD